MYKMQIRDTDAVTAFRKYLVEGRPILAGRKQTVEALFLDSAGQRVTTRVLAYHFRRALMAAELEGTGLSLRGLRRAYLLRWADLTSQLPLERSQSVCTFPDLAALYGETK